MSVPLEGWGLLAASEAGLMAAQRYRAFPGPCCRAASQESDRSGRNWAPSVSTSSPLSATVPPRSDLARSHTRPARGPVAAQPWANPGGGGLGQKQVEGVRRYFEQYPGLKGDVGQTRMCLQIGAMFD
ncbi:MAG TPA: hypothetical protein DEP84_10630 [Chloroflexi bacterium]|nr:hypothetical protein [Chloroflexota bacterium]